jgi:hypothetical protein
MTDPQCKFKFSSSDKNMIIQDWATLLKDMDLVKGLRLKGAFFQRMVGPLLIEFEFEFMTRILGYAKYEPGYSVVNLASKNFSRSITDLDISYRRIELHEHKEKYLGAFENLKKKAWIPIEGPVSLDDIFNGYCRLITVNGHLGFGTPAIIAAWAGEPKKAEQYLDWACQVFRDDIPQLGTKAEFRKFHEEMISDPAALRHLVEDNIAKGDGGYNYFPEIMRQAPYQDIAGAAYKKPKQGT